MQPTEKIKLFGSRDFSGNFDMSIKFIKQNFAPIARGISYLIPVLLVAAFLMPNLFKMYYTLGSSRYNPNVANTIFDDYSVFTVLAAVGGYLLIMLTLFIMGVYVISYMALYVKSEDGVVDSKDVWAKVSKVALPAFGGAILFGLAVIIGGILCYIPGIIAGVYLGFYLYAYINEDIGIIDSFQRSMDLVKNNFWVTLGYSLAFSFIIGMVSIVFVVPFYVGLIGSMLQVEILSSEIFFIISTMILFVGYIFIYSAFYMAMGVMYYSHRNKIEGVDMETEIDSIGSNNYPNNSY
ncbi:hypothetical protein [Prevotella sp. 10(H)]|uniref:hypothetical protein n=1 Tax=Prevotella sp. 10(H) TaxID=1158294 RepID=UPI0004A71BFD|nr:hypothetical protein [Prevotella sp. 10(H)]